MKWRDIAELVGIVAIVISLVFLIVEIRENSLAIEQQAALHRAEAIATPYFESELASILVKISAVDGDSGVPPQFMERYGLTHGEAILWERHLWHIWESLEASYITEGASEKLEKQVRMLLLSPDNRIYIKNAVKYQFVGAFRDYVVDLQENEAEFLKSLDN
ncbi:MAG: hypothetical protein MJA83_15085 [Gammaproteobacteria bacterium]|nr:hypothetical protein [Gammaproteobacteria bacterium]